MEFFSHHKTGAASLPHVISKPAWVQSIEGSLYSTFT